ncbi:MBOAT family O-acyltransferase [Microvirga pudoricolor]|uniref:MBOAT family O-acyltransferase n=1 Tax=Microvirga pudoricolor TaxID=2778729 RepID=UPI001951D4F3|nr:MBOAT family protein [Microvirga pudoricolor]MBM6593445.1 MBOAT family protein [Microvirga pudoricolor]
MIALRRFDVTGLAVLFNSPEFLFGFLPAVLAAYWVLRRWSVGAANLWLLVSSLFFYGWWEARFLPILLASIALNFAFGRAIVRARSLSGPDRPRHLLVAGVTLNLAALAYFKYADFLVSNIGDLLNLGDVLGAHWAMKDIALPIGISFFTFTQIAYLVDTYARKASEPDPVRYGLFVTYFPHLIAGPILHHGEMMPQFASRSPRDRGLDVAVGLTLLSVGLFKKVVIADTISQYSTPVFLAFDQGLRMSFVEAWLGALAYALQIYFDFSAYCDMALGISRMFGILLPVNFLSPYQSASIIDFWRRWHITLSRFLRDYLYIPLGGNRRGTARRYANLALTMLLGGLWHGASWNFVIWGGLHGLYLVINHAYRAQAARMGFRLSRGLSWGLTFLAVVFAWVFFRAETFRGAWIMVKTMLGARGPLLPDAWPVEGLGLVAALLLLCVAAPNMYVVLYRFRPGLYPDWFVAPQTSRRALSWRPSFAAGIGYGALFAVALIVLLQFARESEFLYFQF